MAIVRALVVLAVGVLMASSGSSRVVADQADSETTPWVESQLAEGTHPLAGKEPAATIQDASYTYDPGNPGWAYRWNPEDESGWIRVDLRLFQLGGPPDDPLERPVYVLDPEQAGSAFTGDPALDSHWVSVQNLDTLLATTGEPPAGTAAVSAPAQAQAPPRPPSATATPTFDLGPPPPAGTYELSVNDRVARSAGCCRVWGMYFPLSFPESWRGRTVGITIDNVQWQRRNVYPPLDPRVPPGDYSPPSESGTWEINLYWAPRQLAAGEEFQGSDSCSEPRGSVPCVLVHTAGYWVKSTGWTAEPGRYFLFFRDHDTRYHERRVLNVRFRVSYPT